MEIKENEEFNVITDNSKVNINLLKQIETLKAENEGLRKDKKLWIDRATQMQQETLDLIKEVNSHKLDKAKLKEALKDIRSQLFDAKNCETILTKSIDALIND